MTETKPLTYESFCGSVLDDMLDQIIHNIISKSLLNERIIRSEYGTIDKPILHNSPYFTAKFENKKNTDDSQKKNRTNNNDNNNDNDNDDSNDDDDDYDSKDESDEDSEDEIIPNSRKRNLNNQESNGKYKKNKINSVNTNGKKFGNINLNADNIKQYEEPDIGRFEFLLNGKDIYVNALNNNSKILGEYANLISPGTGQDTYFKCSNCDRKIAGSRFGAHIDKCLGGRSRK